MDKFRSYILKKQEELGISQNQLAARVGKTSGWISRFMTGDRKDIKVESLIGLAKALRVSPSQLIAAYEGLDPDEAEDSGEIDAAILEFFNHLPARLRHKILTEVKDSSETLKPLPPQGSLMMQALMSRPPQEVFEKLVAARGEEQVMGMIQEMLRRKDGEKDFPEGNS